ncbi:Tip41p KNAG_0F03450 [Huiozyma naganishii CBS 8797]|uniref:Type 2A phosphatase activator TIP41 n=1 Tax=Huiozyma naganishii (strain ATCC MYA-139 / BCRC 22969 / CBS 8797 / KCTC 17520 / NBRC 10181 / NCYC 3082 / Yp74L-3) TaxID=1071383 RepID=J7S0I8_HUIN7|nr:hypothetical protein KNAG_0F03450 [Kazachstania naganishii CBS 8797]CCK71007.1 hypothetical protein KNAG_0F03450 [Kazachstania naganishii CBS 8797]
MDQVPPVTRGRQVRSLPLPHRCNNPRNPACAHCGTVIIPSPAAIMPLEDTPSISVGSWTIESRKRPILDTPALSQWESEHLPGLGALPEMIFGGNYVRIRCDLDESKHWDIEFNALDALREVPTEDSGVRVSCASDWLRSKHRRCDGAPPQIAKQYDWTYTTRYRGTVTGCPLVADTTAELPLAMLAKPDPILFFDDMVLYEDELGDNGASMYSCKVRVMPERLLLLARFFLRVDDVLLRVQDTRLYVEFAQNRVVREWKRYEADYNEVFKRHRGGVPPHRDLRALLRDSNWVVDHLPIVERTCETIQL